MLLSIYLERIHAGRKDEEDRGGGAGFLERFGELDGPTFHVSRAELFLDKRRDRVGHSIGPQRPQHAQTLYNRLVLPFLREFLPLRTLAFHQLFPSLRRGLYVSVQIAVRQRERERERKKGNPSFRFFLSRERKIFCDYRNSSLLARLLIPPQLVLERKSTGEVRWGVMGNRRRKSNSVAVTSFLASSI